MCWTKPYVVMTLHCRVIKRLTVRRSKLRQDRNMQRSKSVQCLIAFFVSQHYLIINGQLKFSCIYSIKSTFFNVKKRQSCLIILYVAWQVCQDQHDVIAILWDGRFCQYGHIWLWLSVIVPCVSYIDRSVPLLTQTNRQTRHIQRPCHNISK